MMKVILPRSIVLTTVFLRHCELLFEQILEEPRNTIALVTSVCESTPNGIGRHFHFANTLRRNCRSCRGDEGNGGRRKERREEEGTKGDSFHPLILFDEENKYYTKQQAQAQA